MNDNKEVARSLNKGVAWSAIGNFATIAVQFLAMVVLARYLSPRDFAVMGIATFFISISQIMIDSGMGGALIQKKEATETDLSTLFIFNMIISILMYMIMMLASIWLAGFYNIENLRSILSVVGISCIIAAFGITQNVALYRELKFKEMSFIRIVSACVSLLVATVLAVKGFGVWALVYQNLTNHIVTILMKFYYSKFIPKFIFSVKSFRQQWNWGYHILLTSLLTTIYNNVFLMIFPKVSSFHFSGLYVQANRIQQIPVTVTTSVLETVLFPIFSKIEDTVLFNESKKSFARKTYLYVSAILIGLAILSESIISIILGNDWIEVAPILSILSLSGIFLIVTIVSRNILKAKGYTKAIFQIQTFNTITGLLVLAITFSVGEYFILWGIVLANFITMLYMMYRYKKLIGESIKAQLYDFILAQLILIPAAILTSVILQLMNINYIFTLIVGGCIYVLLILLFGLLLKNKEVCDLINLINKKR